MTNQFKRMLLKMARLSKRDQSWILRQLSDHEKSLLDSHEGISLLQTAQRFRIINAIPPEASQDETDNLPDFCQQLASKPALYTAIVIYEGEYDWQSDFLQTFDIAGDIRRALDNQVTDIKPAVRACLHIDWERRHSFASYLEGNDG